MTAPTPERHAAEGRGITKEILNLGEAAAFLGVSVKTMQKVLRAGDVPGRKIGREWKFSRPALLAWVGAGRSADFLGTGDDEPRGTGRSRTRDGGEARGGENAPRRKSQRRRSSDRGFSAEED